MSKVKSLHSSPQLVFEQQGVAVAPKQLVSLFNKSQQSGYPIDTILEVYCRGFSVSMSEQDGFNRVNSFINGGHAYELDIDLVEAKKGLWANIHAKRERIKRGSGEHMRKPGSEGAPSKQDLIRSQSEEYTGAEPTSTDKNKPSSRFDATTQLTKVYKGDTPGQGRINTIKKVIKELSVRDPAGKKIQIHKKPVRGADGKITMQYPGKSSSSGGGGNGD